jgi:threonine dehydrogenase-like Zn-dependent dehydrogenase
MRYLQGHIQATADVTLMRAFVITGPHEGGIEHVPRPRADPGEAVVDVERVGLCGTDVELFTGVMSYLHSGRAAYPVRIGHEWCGVVTAVGDPRDASWVGRRVAGDTMLACGRCERCRNGLRHVCADRHELGITSGWPGALAEQVRVPISALHALPDSVDSTLGALVEPGGNALRALRAAAVRPGERLLVLGAGTIGLLVGLFAVHGGAEVHLFGRSEKSLAFARSLGFANAWSRATLPDLPFHAVVDASNSPSLPALAVDLVEPGRRVVFIGLAGEPSLVDARTVSLKDVTIVGILGASAGLAETIDRYSSSAVDPRAIVAATLPLEAAADVLAGIRQADCGDGPKVHIDPQR